MNTSTVTLVNGQLSPKNRVIENSNIKKNVAPLRLFNKVGVTPISANSRRKSEREVKWFLMRAAYGQEMKAYEYLSGKEGVETVFCPQWLQERSFNGKKKKIMVSIIPNTLFVKSSEVILKNYIGRPPLTFFHHYYKKNTHTNIFDHRQPIVIPENQILSFQQWLNADDENKIYMNEEFKFKKNDIVRVTEGKFEGFVGHVVRFKGQTRVGINIEGVGFISTTYIPKNCLELVES